jgi:hypothetical protein
MSDQKGEVVDFTDDPQESSFGRNAEGGFINDPIGNAEKAVLGNFPIVSQIYNISQSIDKALDPPQSYFHGEWWEELFVAMQAASDIGVQIADAFDIGKSIGNALTGNVLDAVGAAAGMVCKGVLDWLWSSVQPVQDAAGVLLGNPGKVMNSSGMWKAVAENLGHLVDALGPDLGNTLNQCWTGKCGSAAAVRAGDLLDTVQFASESSSGLSELLEIYADMAERINDLVRQLLADVVAALIAAAGDIATKGLLAIIPVGIDLAIMLTQYTLRLISIAIQEAWFIIAGTQLVLTIQRCFENSMTVLRELSGYGGSGPLTV